MTFDPHPREVLTAQYSKILTPIAEKMRLFAELGVDQVYIVHFTPELARVSPEDYYKNMLYPLKPRVIVVGFDFTFGHRGQGTAETLAKLAKAGESIEVIAPHNMNGEKISSTLIREQLHLGRLERVKPLLGRHYRIQGKVVKGKGQEDRLPYGESGAAGPLRHPAARGIRRACLSGRRNPERGYEHRHQTDVP